MRSSTAEWANFLFMRDNPKGEFAERWMHAAGCRRWFNMKRHTVTHEILAVYKHGRDGAMSQPHRLQTGGASTDHERSRSSSTIVATKAIPATRWPPRLLANGVHLVARSFKYHRPRGIMTAGVEEPNAMVQVGEGGRTVPNVKATESGLYDGLVAKSVNVFPSVQFDAGAAIGALSRFMPAGFYYKTFFGSRFLWQRVFEPVIRHAGGWGKAPAKPDPDTYDRTWHHCDILIVGAGPAGLMAARTAATTGARVTLADRRIPAPS
jgi:sarcosine oxidase, subunit alpha